MEQDIDSRSQRPPSWKCQRRDNYAADDPIHMKFGVPVQTEMPTTTGRLKLKTEVKFQYGGRSFLHDRK